LERSNESIQSTFRFAVFASGEGTNASALFKHDNHSLIKLLVCDNEDALVINKARSLGISVAIIPKEEGESRSSHEAKILSLLKVNGINWILLAGYLRILSSEFISNFFDPLLSQNRIINIHPSLLPAYPGLRAYERAFEAGESESGVSVHFVSAGVDEGAIILQKSFARKSSDSLGEFIARGKELEHQLYCQVFDQIILNNILSPVGDTLEKI